MQAQDQRILKTGPKTSGKSPRLNVSLPKSMMDAVEAEAQRLNISESEALRRFAEVGIRASSLLTSR